MRVIMVASLMLLVSCAFASPLLYKASCTAAAGVTTKATGLASISLLNSTYATGFFYATGINQMTAAHLHAGAVGKTGPPIAWAFNATYGPVSGSVKASFTFNPSLNNISALLAAGLVYFNIHTIAYPAGELRGQLAGPSNISYPAPPAPAPPTAAADDNPYSSSISSAHCTSKVSSTPPPGYLFYPQMTLNKTLSYFCGNLSSTSTYQGVTTDSDVSLSSICNNQSYCAGFIIFYAGLPFNEDTKFSPDSFCLKYSNDPSLLVSASSTFMTSICYGFYSKQAFNYSTSPYPMMTFPPDDPYAPTLTHASVKVSPTEALSVPPKVTVPTTRKKLPADYVFMPDDESENADGKRRTLKQSIYGNDPLKNWGGPTIAKTVVCYTIWLGFTEDDPYVAWTHYYLANVDKSSAYRVIRNFTNSAGKSLEGLVKLAGTTFLTPTVSASLAASSVSSSNINAVVKYALDNKLVSPAAPQNLYFVFSKTDNPYVISPPDDGSAGWHSSEDVESCFMDPEGKEQCIEGPCSCTNDLKYTYSYVPTPNDNSIVNYFYNHDLSLAPSGDQKIEYFVDTVNHEVMETVTDPIPTYATLAWYTAGKPEGENGDLCNNILLPSVQITDDGTTSMEDETPQIPENVFLPTTTISSISGESRTVAYNTMIGGVPYILQAQYLPTINPATGRQWGCVLGIDDAGKPIKDPRVSKRPPAVVLQPPPTSKRPPSSDYPMDYPPPPS